MTMTDPTTWTEYVQYILTTVNDEGHPDSDDVRAVHTPIIENLMRGKFRHAEHGCLVAFESEPEDSLLWTLYTLAIWDTGDGDGIRQSIQKAHDISNSYSLTWNLMADFSNRLGQTPQAVFSYEASLLIDGNQILPRKHLYAIYKIQQRWDKAFEHVKELVRLVPDDTGSWGNLDESLEHLGDPESGQKLVQELTVRYPTNYLSWWLWGTVMVRCRRWQEAEKAARRALELCRDDPDCYTLLGNVLLQTKRAKAAIKHFRRVTEMAPEKGYGWYNLGNALTGVGMVNEAEQAYQRFADIDPKLNDRVLAINLERLRTGKGPDRLRVK